MEIDPFVAAGVTCIGVGLGIATCSENANLQKVASVAHSIFRQIGEDFALFFRVETAPCLKRKINPNPGFIRGVILNPIKNAFENIGGIFYLIYALYILRKRRVAVKNCMWMT